jgi:hypothetical protein
LIVSCDNRLGRGAAALPLNTWAKYRYNLDLTHNSEKKENANEKDDVVPRRIDTGYGLRNDGQR